jgi:hypothetical protein
LSCHILHLFEIFFGANIHLLEIFSKLFGKNVNILIVFSPLPSAKTVFERLLIRGALVQAHPEALKSQSQGWDFFCDLTKK